MTQLSDIVITRAIIKTNPELRTEILNTISSALRKYGIEIKPEFLTHVTLATPDELKMARAHVVELD